MFTYNIQLAGYPYEKFDEKGETDLVNFTHMFEAFPWLEQLDSYDKIKEGCSATISVKAINDDIDFWVSVAGNRDKYVFLIGIVYLKPRRGLLGFGKEKVVRWVDIFETETKEKIISLFSLFFDKKYEVLKSELSMLKKFESMKAFIQ